MKIMCHTTVDKMVTFRAPSTTERITRKQLEEGESLRGAVEQDLVFMKGVPNFVHYWMERKREVFAMIRELARSTAFLAMSASEMHWERPLELLE